MRIPSQFHQRSLYPSARTDEDGSRSERTPSASPAHTRWRRVLRLVLALVVVLLVMRQAARPELYHVFFPVGSVPYRPNGAVDGPPRDSSSQAILLATPGDEGSVESNDATQIPEDLRAKMETVADGTTWRGSDLGALEWMRNESERVSIHNAETVSVLPLLQQPEQYQGRRVVVRGTVARLEVVQDYFQLWMKPNDGSNRPILVIVNQVPDSLRTWDETKEPLGPRVVIAGRFLKRLAYRSGKGADVAPVVVGRIDRISADFADGTNSVAQEKTIAKTNQNAWWIVTLAVLLGVGGTGILVWMSVRQREEMRRRRREKQSAQVNLSVMLVFLTLLGSGSLRAQSLMDSLGRFDRDALEAIYPFPNQSSGGEEESPKGRDSISEMAKLIYQLQRLSSESFQSDSVSADTPKLGEALAFEGQLVAVKSFRLPDMLADFLDMPTFHLLTVQKRRTGAPKSKPMNPPSAGQSENDEQVESMDVGEWVGVFAAQVPRLMKEGDFVSGSGVSLLGEQPADRTGLFAQVVAAPRVAWTPQRMTSQGWVLLDQGGFDLARLDEIRPRQRQPLGADDRESFYGMLAAAGRVDPVDRVAKPIPLVDLLSNPSQLAGDWVRLRLDALRVTRVEAIDAVASLGQDHYYQIDAVGDLGNVIVKIEANDEDGKALEMDGRFPVSIVATELPTAWNSTASDESVVSATNRRPIQVDGFFYRLWSYESDLSSRVPGSSDQIGPLIMATSIRPIEQGSRDPVGVRRIGWAICISLIGGTFLLLFWQAWNRRSDRRAQESQARKKQTLPSSIDWPE